MSEPLCPARKFVPPSEWSFQKGLPMPIISVPLGSISHPLLTRGPSTNAPAVCICLVIKSPKGTQRWWGQAYTLEYHVQGFHPHHLPISSLWRDGGLTKDSDSLGFSADSMDLCDPE